MRDILQNNLSVLFKSIKLVKDKVRQKKCCIGGGQGLNTLCNSGLNTGTEKGH